MIASTAAVVSQYTDAGTACSASVKEAARESAENR